MKKLLMYKPLKYVLYTLMLLFVFTSCDEDETSTHSGIIELLATASTDKTVADGGEVKFIDLSLGVKNRVWTFPNGDPAVSEVPEVDVIFQEEGEVIVTLEVEFIDGTKETTQFPITVFPELIADFTPSQTKIKVGETVTFTDTSIGNPTSWFWEFEGGTPATSTEQNPTVTFNVNKPVTVLLTVIRALDESEAMIEKTDLVQVGPVELMYNGSFEDGLVTDFQTWAGVGFPLNLVSGGANGTGYAVYYDHADYGAAEIMSRDKPADKMITVENGKSYTVSVYLKADEASVLQISWFQLGNNPLSPWDYSSVWGTNGQVLTTEWQKVSFVANIPNDGKVRGNSYPNFSIGKVDGSATINTKVYMDEFSIKIVE
ncbi:carbohydrate binding domain-containing protein [Polaribacter litorisediminis]|uniref:PKD domain-containing protein n=1 Tax=Polaribacter litorisediminis TaxID=1908341 RepID=UPI001CBDF16C|nr:PKD domain-containing protein [Polaribacter litorisediminis]UAM97145.1 carbohydrate binding domain-containing protein [Polaribacter litorisediminis]